MLGQAYVCDGHAGAGQVCIAGLRGVRVEAGVEVRRVEPASAAGRSPFPFSFGDVVTHVDGVPIRALTVGHVPSLALLLSLLAPSPFLILSALVSRSAPGPTRPGRAGRSELGCGSGRRRRSWRRWTAGRPRH